MQKVAEQLACLVQDASVLVYVFECNTGIWVRVTGLSYLGNNPCCNLECPCPVTNLSRLCSNSIKC